MNPDRSILDPAQRAMLREAVAPEGLWECIAAQARTMEPELPVVHPPQAVGQVGPSRWRRTEVLRFLAAGMLGFLSFFGMEQLLTLGGPAGTHASVSAEDLHLVQHLRQNIPLMAGGDTYLTDFSEAQSWPEVELATFFQTAEVH